MMINTIQHHRYAQSVSSIRCFFLIVIFIFLVGCGSQAAHSKAPLHVATTEQKLRDNARQWLETPYRQGGLNHKGVDCSGLVTILYRELFNRHLPRTTRLLVQQGEAVDRDALKAGDLVFFQPRNKVRHVGLYLGRGEFLHATTRRGVIISHLSESYWRRSYWTARRLLQS